MKSDYTKMEVTKMREDLTKARNKRLGKDSEEVVLFSNLISLLQDVIISMEE